MNHSSNATTSASSGSHGPLDGIVVADLSRILAGPYCTMLLADLGATVIKIEPPRGDDTRHWRPPQVDGWSTYFLSVNRNKQSITLDLRDSADLKTAYDIIERADVLVENFKPGGLEKFGLDRSQTAQRWPHLIHASITGFGTTGGAGLPGYDLLAQALSGFMHVTGDPEGDPQRAGVAIFDVFTGLHAAIGILASLVERSASGEGQAVEVNLLSSALSAMVNQTAAFTAAGVEPFRMGNEHPSLYPYGPFHAKDGEIVICCGNDTQFRKLMNALGLDHLADDELYTTVERRNANRDTLRTLMEEQLAAHTVEEWFETLTAAGLSSAPILSVGGGIAYADKLGLNPVWGSDEPGSYKTVANPITFNRTPAAYHNAPPELGADSDDVRRWISQTQPHTH